MNRSSNGISSKSAQNNTKDFSLVADKKPLLKYDLPFGGPSAVKLEDKKMQLAKIEKTPTKLRQESQSQKSGGKAPPGNLNIIQQKELYSLLHW